MVLETVMAQKKRVDNRLSAVLVSLSARTVTKTVNAPKFIDRIAEAVIDSPGFVASVAALVKSKKLKLNDETTNIEEHCRKPVEEGTKTDPHDVSIPSKAAEEPPIDIYSDLETNPKFYSLSTS